MKKDSLNAKAFQAEAIACEKHEKIKEHSVVMTLQVC